MRRREAVTIIAQQNVGKDRVPFRRSLQTKFALTYIAIIAAVLVLLNTYPVLVSQDLMFRAKQVSLLSQASVISSTLAGPDSLNVKGVGDVLATMGLAEPGGLMENESRLMITDAAGLVLYDTDERVLNHYALIREITTALQGEGRDVFWSEYRDGAFRSRAAVPIVYRTVNLGAVYLYEYDKAQGGLLLDIQQNLRSISIVISVVALILSLMFSKALTRRIAALLGAVRIVREGEYSHRVNIAGGDELTQLAAEFNELTGRLQTTEEVRRRFVSDASHELKTPLASIRLLTDSILQNDSMDEETAREFVTDIGDEAERLTRITEKLLTLTRMDTAPLTDLYPVDVGAVLGRVRRMLMPLARAVEIQLELELAEDCVVLATEDDLYQIAFNLMENAVKYNLPGGRVVVRLFRSQDAVVLRVEDTGVGIPADDLPKVFDRFYRVDKARSRAAGGTGLGLSIVRETARQHGGSVTAQQRAGEGTCFEVKFPPCPEEEVEK